jgi:carbamoyl-phosphate synthase large subunit
MKVLVTGAGALLGQGIIRSLRMATTPYEIVAVDPNPCAVGLYWADHAHLVPFASDPNYLDRISKILELERPAAVLIGTDVELLTFAKHKSELEPKYQTCVIVSSSEVISIADDKWLTYQFLASNGFPCPRSALIETIPALLQTCDFPLVVKPRKGARSVGMYIVRNKAELAFALKQVKEPIIQECVGTDDQEYTSGVLLDSARVAKAVVTMRRDLRDGNTYRAYVEPNASFDPLLARIAEKLGGMGPLNFQFRIDQGIPKIFEINARFSGTTPFRTHAGFNEVNYILRHHVLGESIPEPIICPVSVFRYWNEIIVKPNQISLVPDIPLECCRLDESENRVA